MLSTFYMAWLVCQLKSYIHSPITYPIFQLYSFINSDKYYVDVVARPCLHNHPNHPYIIIVWLLLLLLVIEVWRPAQCQWCPGWWVTSCSPLLRQPPPTTSDDHPVLIRSGPLHSTPLQHQPLTVWPHHHHQSNVMSSTGTGSSELSVVKA